jgi:hypothetical protein
VNGDLEAGKPASPPRAALVPGGFQRPFAWYWLSGFPADFGDGVRLAAFPLLAAQLTRSPVAVAAVTAVQGLP